MEYVITITTSVASAMLVFILQAVIRENRKLKHEKDEQRANEATALKEGVLCLLRVKMIEYHKQYMDTGHISSNGFQNWMLMYKAYRALGGNGMIDHMKDEIEELHIEVN
jgi:hypothetical protein